MSTTTEGAQTLERFLTSQQRRNPIVLPQGPGDEELARDWTLSEADKAERTLSQLAKRYNARALKRFAETKRHAIVAFFLVEAQMTTLDHIVAMHDQFVAKMTRSAKKSYDERYREVRKKAKAGFDTVLSAVEILLESVKPRSEILDELYSEITERDLREAKDACRELQQLESRGFVDAFRARLRGDHEQGDVPESPLECRGCLEHGAHGQDS